MWNAHDEQLGLRENHLQKNELGSASMPRSNLSLVGVYFFGSTLAARP